MRLLASLKALSKVLIWVKSSWSLKNRVMAYIDLDKILVETEWFSKFEYSSQPSLITVKIVHTCGQYWPISLKCIITFTLNVQFIVYYDGALGHAIIYCLLGKNAYPFAERFRVAETIEILLQ